MKIILSPTKKMEINTDVFQYEELPALLYKTEELLCWFQSKSKDELKQIWKCNDSIVDQNIERISTMDLRKQLTTAILAYQGLAFQYMAPIVFEESQLNYIQDHLRILSGFYGVLKPGDGVVPYRLEMGAKCDVNGFSNLYDFWSNKFYEEVRDDSGIIINLASKEYSKCIEKYLTEEDYFVTISFVEKVNDKLVTKGTYAKMARGEMVRFMAENVVEQVEDLKKFDRLGYVYRDDLSNENTMVFERINKSHEFNEL